MERLQRGDEAFRPIRHLREPVNDETVPDDDSQRKNGPGGARGAACFFHQSVLSMKEITARRRNIPNAHNLLSTKPHSDFEKE
jgi:hypothetical protein